MISCTIKISSCFSFSCSIAALTVRYLTRRYIGEYRSKTDLLYRQTISLDSGLLDVEIVDVSAETDNEFPIEQIQWADSCLIVYSITDRESFKYATRALGNLKSLQNGPSAYLIANKADLDHLREVSDASEILFLFFWSVFKSLSGIRRVQVIRLCFFIQCKKFHVYFSLKYVSISCEMPQFLRHFHESSVLNEFKPQFIEVFELLT